MRNWLVVVQTYNRPGPLRDLLCDLLKTWEAHDKRAGETLRVLVADDASTPPVDVSPLKQAGLDVELLVANKTHGRAGFGVWTTAVYRALRELEPADLYVLLPDDVRLCRDFFGQVDLHWAQCPPRTVSLSLSAPASLRNGNWGSGTPTSRNNHVLESGWVDGGCAVSRDYFEHLEWQVPRFHPNTSDEMRGSGVGAATTLALRAKGSLAHMCMTRRSLFVWRHERSQMNPVIRCHVPVVTVDFIDGEQQAQLLASDQPIVAGMATTPERIKFAVRAAESLAHQADVVAVYVNLSRETQEEIENQPSNVHWAFGADKSDGAKFRALQTPTGIGAYMLSCDDDILYPPDYAQRMISAIEAHDRKAVVTLHGSTFPSWPVSSYYRGRKNYHCQADLDTNQPVYIVGTGVSAWHSSTVPPWTDELFERPRMADLWFSRHLQTHQIPAVCLAHRKDYLDVLEVPNTIYDQFRQEGDKSPTEVANMAPWRIYT
jgi:hypothetical protein